MLVEDVITLAKHSELNGVAVKNDVSAIVTFINLGMIEIYKRFTLNTKEFVFEVQENALSVDVPDDFMYAERAYQWIVENNERKQVEITIDESYESKGINFLNFRRISLSPALVGITVYIVYNAKPPKYSSNKLDTELELPESLVDCLLHYIGYRGHLGVKSDGQSENNTHYLRFERSVSKAKELNVTPTTQSLNMSTRVFKRGFV
jgi:hypothetical protein